MTASGVPMSAKGEGAFQTLSYGQFFTGESDRACMLSLDLAKQIAEQDPGSLLGKSPTLSYAASISNGKEPDSSGGVQVQRVDLQCRIVGIVERDPGPFPAGGGSPVSGVMIPLAIARMIDAEAVTTAQSLLRDPLLPRSYGSLTVRAKHAQFTQDVDGDGFLDIFNKSLSSDGDIRR